MRIAMIGIGSSDSFLERGLPTLVIRYPAWTVQDRGASTREIPIFEPGLEELVKSSVKALRQVDLIL